MSTYPFIPIAKRYEKEDEHGRPIGDFCFDYELGLIMTSKMCIRDSLGTCGNNTLYNLLGEQGIDDNNRNGNQGDDSKRLSHGCIIVGCDRVQTDLSGQKIAGREHQ